MQKNLVLFTASFPYEGGEQFLETEIEYLSKRFDNIIVVPAKRNRKIRDIKKYKNIVVDESIYKIDKSIKNRLKSLFDIKYLLNLRVSYSWNRYLAIRMIYINRYLEWIDNFQKNYNYSFENTLFYTYWFEAETIALSLAKRKNPSIKFVTRAHGGDLYEEVHNLSYFPMRKKVLKNIDRVFPISNKGKEHLIKKYRVSDLDKKIIVSRLGVKAHGKMAKPSDRDRIHLVSCSSLIEIKRVHLIIKALALLVNKNIEILWTHIGDGKLKDSLEKKAKRALKINVRYRFIGRLSNSDVYRFYENNRVDLFINVSKNEGIPVSIMEAQSFGIPCIATDVGANSEIVDNSNGILLRANPKPKEIAKILSNYFKDIKSWQEKRINSFNNQKRRYNASINYNLFCDRLEDVYYG